MDYKDQIIDRINGFPDAKIFIAQDFFDIAGYETVRSTLNRLVTRGALTRVMKGLYGKRQDDDDQPYEIEEIAQALARKYGWTITPSGETVLKRFELSTEFVNTWTFISDGPYTSFTYDSMTLEFKHRRTGDLTGKSEITLLMIQAIKALGKDNIGPRELYLLQCQLKGYDTDKILDEAKTTSAWVYRILRRLCDPTPIEFETGQER